jgi:hypothetical protein
VATVVRVVRVVIGDGDDRWQLRRWWQWWHRGQWRRW